MPGALGKIGIASESARTRDHVVEASHSSFPNRHRIYLLARWMGEYYDIVGRVYLQLENNQVSTNPGFDREQLRPTKESLCVWILL